MAEPPECLTVGTPVGNKCTNSPMQNINPFLHEKKPWRLSLPLPQPEKRKKDIGRFIRFHPLRFGWTDPVFLTVMVPFALDGACWSNRMGKEVYRAKGNDIPPEAVAHRNVAGEIFGILESPWNGARHKGITEVENLL